MQRAAVDADMAPLEAVRVGEASAGGDDKVLQVHGIGAGEPASDLRPLPDAQLGRRNTPSARRASCAARNACRPAGVPQYTVA